MKGFTGWLILMVGVPLWGGSGFLLPKGDLYLKLAQQFESVDKIYTVDGDTSSQPAVTKLEDGLDTNVTSLYAGWGTTSRFAISAFLQYREATLHNRFAADSGNSGLSDLRLSGQYLLWRKRIDVVLNAEVKIPFQENEPIAPQLTNGELAYALSLGTGYGTSAYFLEGEAGYIWNDGTVNDVRVNGLPYENEVFGNLKAGWHLTPRLDLEGTVTSRWTEADLSRQSIAIYTNSDETSMAFDLRYQWRKNVAAGLYFGRTVAGRNALLTESVGLNIHYRWSP